MSQDNVFSVSEAQQAEIARNMKRLIEICGNKVVATKLITDGDFGGAIVVLPPRTELCYEVVLEAIRIAQGFEQAHIVFADPSNPQGEVH